MRHTNKLAVVAMVVLALAVVSTGCARKATKASGGAAGLNRVHFDFDAYNIKSEYDGTMKGNADWLQKNKSTKLTVEGHCDERGTAEYNIALGDRRAKSAKNYLQNLGVDSNRISTISYGKERPLCLQHDESCWWQNRRDEFVAK